MTQAELLEKGLTWDMYKHVFSEHLVAFLTAPKCGGWYKYLINISVPSKSLLHIKNT